MFDNVLISKIKLGKQILSQDTFHVAFGISSNYTRPIGILCKSILANSPNRDYVFHIFSDGQISKKEMKRFQQLVDNYNSNVIIYYFDNKLFSGLDDKEFTIAAYYRLAIPTLLKDMTKRFLYLDADMVAVNDLYSMTNVDLGDKIAGVVKEFSIKSIDGSKIEYNSDFYFNSGMMYVDIEKWLQAEISERCMEILKEINLDESKKEKYGYDFRCYDQDALNIVLKGKTKFLEPRYNFLANISLKSNKNLVMVPENAVLVHYHGFNKPWHEWCYHPLNKYYRQQVVGSPWEDVPWDNKPTKYRQMRLYANYYLKKGDIANAVKWLYRSIKAKGAKK